VESKKRLDINLDKDGIVSLYGIGDENLRLIEKEFKVGIVGQNDKVLIRGEKEQLDNAEKVLRSLKEHIQKEGRVISKFFIRQVIDNVKKNEKEPTKINMENNEDLISLVVSSKREQIRPKTRNQNLYIKKIFDNQIVFAIGPAGTGKTYLAVAAGLYFLREKKVERIVLVRPVVEAGEKLGFLPGDVKQKIDPYLRPLFDAIFDMIDPRIFQELVENEIIEIAPLAYMRGRTLNKAFIILDEAQNTTIDQMKMFLTRLGNDSKAVITGDITQIDLSPGKKSGLIHAQEIFREIDGLATVNFTSEDVARAQIVKKILEAYEKYDKQE